MKISCPAMLPAASFPGLDTTLSRDRNKTVNTVSTLKEHYIIHNFI